MRHSTSHEASASTTGSPQWGKAAILVALTLVLWALTGCGTPPRSPVSTLPPRPLPARVIICRVVELTAHDPSGATVTAVLMWPREAVDANYAEMHRELDEWRRR